MKTSFRVLTLPLLALASLTTASAQPAAVPTAFPEGATPLSSEDLRARLNDKVMWVRQADGNAWRLEFNARGHFFVNTSAGFAGKGEWSVEDGRLCSQMVSRPRGCNEVRLHQDTLYLKRDTGEIIQYLPK